MFLTHTWQLQERLAKDWTAPIYAFFAPRPSVELVDKRYCHEFRCAAYHCKGRGPNPRIVRRFLNTGDASSTGNMRRHAKRCWGGELVKKADAAKANVTVNDIRGGLASAKVQEDGSITAAFERQGKGKRTYSARAHTYIETRY